jgi:hypothetical protein
MPNVTHDVKRMNMKKQTMYAIVGVIVVTLACTLGTPPAPTQPQGNQVETAVAATMQALTAPAPSEVVPTEAPTQINGTSVSCQSVSLVIPNGLAGGVNAEAVPAVGENDGAPWEVAPAHVKCTLTGYQLQDKFHQPTIFVYPADEYAQVHSGAAQEIDRLKKILAGTPPAKDTLPHVPFFNATPMIAANIQIVPFQNGQGVRALTEYAQYSAPINNHDLFYLFQGLTRDNKYYVIAVLPITAPILAEDNNPSASIPAGGVPLPAGGMPDEAYYISVTNNLNMLAPDSYAPSLNTLDALIQSVLVTNP